MARRLPPPLTVEEGPRMTAPMSGVKELIDNQKEQLYSKDATDAFGMQEVPKRVFTTRDGRRRNQTPVLLEEKRDNGNVVSNTVTTCLNACGGAMYDIWHWKNLPGNTPERVKTVVSRGGRGPYLLLTFVVILVVIFGIVCFVRSFKQPSRAYLESPVTSIGPRIIAEPRNVPVVPSAPMKAPTSVSNVPAMAPVSQYNFA